MYRYLDGSTPSPRYGRAPKYSYRHEPQYRSRPALKETRDSSDDAAAAARRRRLNGLARNSAVLLLDFQNEFTKEGGKLHGPVKDMIRKSGVLEKVPHAVNVARELGALIIHAPVVMKPWVGLSTDRSKNTAFDQNKDYLKMKGLFVEKEWGCRFTEELRPDTTTDEILTNRSDFNAFRGTQLADLLRNNNIERLYIAGFLTDVCVRLTAQCAFEEMGGSMGQMEIYVLEDGCVANSEHDHSVTMYITMPKYANLVTCKEAEVMFRDGSMS